MSVALLRVTVAIPAPVWVTVKVKLFTDPTQIFLVNVVLSKSRKPGKM